jgi:putative ABC transport system substrate-binding protein
MKKTLILIIGIIFLSACEKKPKDTTTQINDLHIHIITFKSHPVLDAVVNATKKSLINKYHIPKNNIKVFNPNGRLDEVRTYVRTLNSRNTDLIISVSTPTSQVVLSERHPNIPVLFSFVSDVKALKLKNYKNVTGISNVLDYKQGFKLLKTIFPNISKIGVLYNPSERNSNYSFLEIQKVAKNQKPIIDVIARQFTKSNEISLSAASIGKVDAFYVGGDNTLVSKLALLLKESNSKNIPVFASDEGSVKNGALAAYSIDYKKFGLATAEMAYNILKKGNTKNEQIILYKKGECIANYKTLLKFNLMDKIPKSCKIIK